MRQIGFTLGVLLCIFCSVGAALCEEQPQSVTVCQLENDPPAYNHKLVEVTAFVSHDFEDFTLFDPTCPSWPAVWLEYGGKAKSATMYCCGVTADRTRPHQMVVENIPIPLVENDQFREFDRQIQPPFRSGTHGSIVRATVIGRFFSGKHVHYPQSTFWGGYGHMGCCSLLAIQEIKSVSSQDRDDLDYGASADQPDIDKTGCGYRDLTPIQPASDLIRAQQESDLGKRDWAFDDPYRVASDAVAKFAKLEESSIAGLKETRKAQGRFVYQWSPSKGETYMVVVSRPFWLSFYSHDPKRVAWVVAAAYLSSCGKASVSTQGAVNKASFCDVARNPDRYNNQEITVTAQYESDGVEREGLSDPVCKESGFALEILRDTKGKDQLRAALRGGFPGTLDKTVVGTFTGVFHWVPDGHPPRLLRVRSMQYFSVHQERLPSKLPD